MTMLPQTPASQYPNSKSVADRLRAYMGLKKIGRKQLALASGLGRTQLSQKLDGKTEFTLNETMAVAQALGRTWQWLLTGDETDDPTPEGFGLPHVAQPSQPDPDGGESLPDTPAVSLLLPRVDSNHEPSD